MARALLSLGTNLGDRRWNLGEAVRRLRRSDMAPALVSGIYETEPVGAAAGPGWFLNVTAVATTTLGPREVLRACLRIERAMGRVRDVPGGPRWIDIDLLAWEEIIIQQPDLVVPHPRMHERRFVLEPLAEIIPEWTHPRLGRTVAELLDSLIDPSQVRRICDWPGDL